MVSNTMHILLLKDPTRFSCCVHYGVLLRILEYTKLAELNHQTLQTAPSSASGQTGNTHRRTRC